MTDRDRLAADLRAAANEFADDPAAYLDRGDAYDALADRVIALGWRNLAGPEFEERLARVTWDLEPCGDPDCSDRHIGYCKTEIAAIAKALREDTGVIAKLHWTADTDMVIREDGEQP